MSPAASAAPPTNVDNYDIVVVPYADECGDDMAHIRRVALEIGARQTNALTLRDQELALPPIPSTLPRGA